MMEKFLRPEFAAALWCYFIFDVGTMLFEGAVRPWLKELAQDRQVRLEAKEHAQYVAERLKTWAEKTVEPENFPNF